MKIERVTNWTMEELRDGRVAITLQFSDQAAAAAAYSDISAESRARREITLHFAFGDEIKEH